MPKKQQAQKSKKLHWKEFSTVVKDTQGKETKLPLWYLFNAEGTIRAYVQAQLGGTWIVAVGRPSVSISNTCETEAEAKKLAEDTIAEWRL